ncbi:hypothetical protein DIPPA_09800 [Diplonema papillatum]|nr:hypothetical protein DIPPA_09800 [Diplonema papillatum]
MAPSGTYPGGLIERTNATVVATQITAVESAAALAQADKGDAGELLRVAKRMGIAFVDLCFPPVPHPPAAGGGPAHHWHRTRDALCKAAGATSRTKPPVSLYPPTWAQHFSTDGQHVPSEDEPMALPVAGEASDPSWLATMAALTPSAPLFQSTDSDLHPGPGYAVALLPEPMIVDDYLPSSGGAPLYARAAVHPEQNAWIPLVEKAAAKRRGGWHATPGLALPAALEAAVGQATGGLGEARVHPLSCEDACVLRFHADLMECLVLLRPRPGCPQGYGCVHIAQEMCYHSETSAFPRVLVYRPVVIRQPGEPPRHDAPAPADVNAAWLPWAELLSAFECWATVSIAGARFPRRAPPVDLAGVRRGEPSREPSVSNRMSTSSAASGGLLSAPESRATLWEAGPAEASHSEPFADAGRWGLSRTNSPVDFQVSSEFEPPQAQAPLVPSRAQSPEDAPLDARLASEFDHERVVPSCPRSPLRSRLIAECDLSHGQGNPGHGCSALEAQLTSEFDHERVIPSHPSSPIRSRLTAEIDLSHGQGNTSYGYSALEAQLVSESDPSHERVIPSSPIRSRLSTEHDHTHARVHTPNHGHSVLDAQLPSSETCSEAHSQPASAFLSVGSTGFKADASSTCLDFTLRTAKSTSDEHLPPGGQGIPPGGQGIPPGGQGIPPGGQGIPLGAAGTLVDPVSSATDAVPCLEATFQTATSGGDGWGCSDAGRGHAAAGTFTLRAGTDELYSQSCWDPALLSAAKEPLSNCTSIGRGQDIPRDVAFTPYGPYESDAGRDAAAGTLTLRAGTDELFSQGCEDPALLSAVKEPPSNCTSIGRGQDIPRDLACTPYGSHQRADGDELRVQVSAGDPTLSHAAGQTSPLAAAPAASQTGPDAEGGHGMSGLGGRFTLLESHVAAAETGCGVGSHQDPERRELTPLQTRIAAGLLPPSAAPLAKKRAAHGPAADSTQVADEALPSNRHSPDPILGRRAAPNHDLKVAKPEAAHGALQSIVHAGPPAPAVTAVVVAPAAARDETLQRQVALELGRSLQEAPAAAEPRTATPGADRTGEQLAHGGPPESAAGRQAHAALVLQGEAASLADTSRELGRNPREAPAAAGAGANRAGEQSAHGGPPESAAGRQAHAALVPQGEAAAARSLADTSRELGRSPREAPAAAGAGADRASGQPAHGGPPDLAADQQACAGLVPQGEAAAAQSLTDELGPARCHSTDDPTRRADASTRGLNAHFTPGDTRSQVDIDTSVAVSSPHYDAAPRERADLVSTTWSSSSREVPLDLQACATPHEARDGNPVPSRAAGEKKAEPFEGRSMSVCSSVNNSRGAAALGSPEMIPDAGPNQGADAVPPHVTRSQYAGAGTLSSAQSSHTANSSVSDWTHPKHSTNASSRMHFDHSTDFMASSRTKPCLSAAGKPQSQGADANTPAWMQSNRNTDFVASGKTQSCLSAAGKPQYQGADANTPAWIQSNHSTDCVTSGRSQSCLSAGKLHSDVNTPDWMQSNHSTESVTSGRTQSYLIGAAGKAQPYGADANTRDWLQSSHGDDAASSGRFQSKRRAETDGADTRSSGSVQSSNGADSTTPRWMQPTRSVSVGNEDRQHEKKKQSHGANAKITGKMQPEHSALVPTSTESPITHDDHLCEKRMQAMEAEVQTLTQLHLEALAKGSVRRTARLSALEGVIERLQADAQARGFATEATTPRGRPCVRAFGAVWVRVDAADERSGPQPAAGTLEALRAQRARRGGPHPRSDSASEASGGRCPPLAPAVGALPPPTSPPSAALLKENELLKRRIDGFERDAEAATRGGPPRREAAFPSKENELLKKRVADLEREIEAGYRRPLPQLVGSGSQPPAAVSKENELLKRRVADLEHEVETGFRTGGLRQFAEQEGAQREIERLTVANAGLAAKLHALLAWDGPAAAATPNVPRPIAVIHADPASPFLHATPKPHPPPADTPQPLGESEAKFRPAAADNSRVLRRRLGEAGFDGARAADELEEAAREIRCLRLQAETGKERRKSLGRIAESLSAENDHLRETVAGLQGARGRPADDEQQKEHETLRRKIDSLSSENERLREMAAGPGARGGRTDEGQQKEHEALRRKVESLSSENERLREMVTGPGARGRRTGEEQQKEHETLRRKVESLSSENECLREMVAGLEARRRRTDDGQQKEHETLCRKVESLSSENTRLRQTVTVLESSGRAADEEDRDEQRRAHAALRKEVRELRTCTCEQGCRIRFYETELPRLQELLTATKTSLATAEEDVTDLKARLRVAEKERSGSAQKLATAVERLEDAEERRATAEKRLRTAEERLEATPKRKQPDGAGPPQRGPPARAGDEVAALQTRLLEAERRLSSTQATRDVLLHSLEQRLTASEQRLSEAESENEGLRHEMVKLYACTSADASPLLQHLASSPRRM